MKHLINDSGIPTSRVLVYLSIFRKDHSNCNSRSVLRQVISVVCLALIFFTATSVLADATIRYVRPSAGGPYGTGDGSSYSNAFSGFRAVSVRSGDTLKVCGSFTSSDASTDYFLLSFGVSGSLGSPTTIDGDCSAEGDFAQAVLNASGRMFGIYIEPSSSNITVKNIDLFGVDSEPLYNRCLLRLGSTGDQQEVSNITVSNMRIHDVIHLSDATEANGIWGACNDCLIEENEIYNIPSDGIWLGRAARTTIRNNHIHDVATSGLVTGDCAQIANAPNVLIQGNVLDHSKTDAKNSLIVHTGSPNALITQNHILMGTSKDQTKNTSMSANIQSDGATISGNYISGGWTALAVSGNNIQINTNVITKAYGNNVLAADNGSGQYFYNNTIDCGNVSGATGVNLSGAGYGRTFKNNIIVRCSVGLAKGGSAIEFVFENNLLFDNADNDLYFAMNDKNISADPLFENSSGTYSNPMDYYLRSDSPSVDSGALVGLKGDYKGAAILNTPDIGAFEMRSRIQAPTLETVKIP